MEITKTLTAFIVTAQNLHQGLFTLFITLRIRQKFIPLDKPMWRALALG